MGFSLLSLEIRQTNVAKDSGVLFQACCVNLGSSSIRCFFITVKFAFAVNKIGLKVTDVYHRTALAGNGMVT